MVYTDPDDVPWSAYLAVAGIAAVLVGALLPWYEAVDATTTGLEQDGDGYVTAGVALAALSLTFAFEWDFFARIGAALAGVVTLSIAYSVYDQVGQYGSHDPKYGLYLTALGGAILVVAAIWGSVEANRAAADTDAEGEANGDTNDDASAG